MTYSIKQTSSSPPNLTVMILTFNEQQHLQRCLESIKGIANRIIIIDSQSTDLTQKIALDFGTEFYINPWINYAKQFNWGLDNTNINSEWVMRLDADEVVTPELAKEIQEKLDTLEKNITGIYVKRQVYFMDRWIKHGGYYPTWLLRIWQYNKGFCEERWMDEHIKLTEGDTVRFSHDIVDHNLHGLTTWTEKHNNYATREAVDVLNTLYNFLKYDDIEPAFLGTQAQRKRWLKLKYTQMPLFLRPFIYFIYRYFFLLGFLDGKPGLIWHFLQGFWYRFLVDAKINEIYFKAGKDKEDILTVLKTEYSIDLTIKQTKE